MATSRVTGLLVAALILTLLAGAVLVRLVGDDTPSPWTGGSAADSSPKVGTFNSSGIPREGQPASDFTLMDLEGQPVSLSDWQGRPVLINFWATWCGPCEVEMPAIQAAYEAHQEDDLVVLAVAVDDTAENVERFFARHDLTFQPLMDDGVVSRAYRVPGLPTSFFVNADGQITAVHIGMLNENKIEEYLARGR